MKRKLMDNLLQWKALENNRMPMMLFGARQVGKSYLLLEFAKSYYKNYIYVNFEKEPAVTTFFELSLNTDDLIEQLSQYYHSTIHPQSTLIIFDEIQICPKAITSLKYFCENSNDYHIIAAGSLLGVALQRDHVSFPVGKVLFQQLFPLDFEEFLMAKGENQLLSLIRLSYQEKKAMPELWHKKAIQFYYEYMICGGMPAAVNAFIQNGSIPFKQLQGGIINAYLFDMSKYATPSEAVRIRACYRSLPPQLSKDNHKFQYKIIQKGATASKYSDAIAWLIDSGIIINVTKAKLDLLPMKNYADPSFFKLYLSDVGLLSNLYDLDTSIFQRDEYALFKGGLTENYVAQQLQAIGYEPFYYESNGKAEIDFLITKNHEVLPMEVKASINTKSKSLQVYMNTYSPSMAIRCSLKNFGFTDHIMYLPLYAIFCL